MQPAGALVIDTQRNTPGHVMGHKGPYVELRPPAGGREGDADPTRVRPATNEEQLGATREQARAVNLLHRQGTCG
ncbi:hypothetical protein [Streptomyces sp. NPDC048419]|uniref:hypothetical protein n=1 Tax=Streptomyces sp. NPDC048419 TaxID=3365547 RepID=UPI00371EF51D